MERMPLSHPPVPKSWLQRGCLHWDPHPRSSGTLREESWTVDVRTRGPHTAVAGPCAVGVLWGSALEGCPPTCAFLLNKPPRRPV